MEETSKTMCSITMEACITMLKLRLKPTIKGFWNWREFDTLRPLLLYDACTVKVSMTGRRVCLYLIQALKSTLSSLNRSNEVACRFKYPQEKGNDDMATHTSKHHCNTCFQQAVREGPGDHVLGPKLTAKKYGSGILAASLLFFSRVSSSSRSRPAYRFLTMAYTNWSFSRGCVRKAIPPPFCCRSALHPQWEEVETQNHSLVVVGPSVCNCTNLNPFTVALHTLHTSTCAVGSWSLPLGKWQKWIESRDPISLLRERGCVKLIRARGSNYNKTVLPTSWCLLW